MENLNYYIIVITDHKSIYRVLRILRNNDDNVRIYAIALSVVVKDPRILGGVKRIKNVGLLRGFMPLPVFNEEHG